MALGFSRNRMDKSREKTHQAVKKTSDTWFGRIIEVFRSNDLDDTIWDEVEEILISADVGVQTTLTLIQELKQQVRKERLRDPHQLTEALKQVMIAVLQEHRKNHGLDLVLNESRFKPLVILMVGVNGVGKTTSIGKLAYRFKEDKKKLVLGAADTFRAAAIDQLTVLGERVNVDVITHEHGSDPGSVAYDAYQAAKARKADALIIDTAGRMHTKTNLMEELKKIQRVLNRLDSSSPHEVILVVDATTGHNGLNQAQYFTEAVACTGVFLTKLDGTAKGGIVLAISRELKLPILAIGTGESLEDMAPFDAVDFVDALLASGS